MKFTALKMIWIEKYKPKSFGDFLSHSEIIELLKGYTLDNVPNLIFYGGVGFNKKTLLFSFINHLYGNYPKPVQRSIELSINSTKLLVDYLESDELVVINPSEYGFKDRHVIQKIIKQMAETKPISSFFSKKKRNIKIIIIEQSENLSMDAQAALRRTMEIYSTHFRIFMISTEISRLIEPIRSRTLFIRIRGFTDLELNKIIDSVLIMEGVEGLNRNIISKIIKNSENNCSKALSLLELVCFNNIGKNTDSIKRIKIDQIDNYKLDYELRIIEICLLCKEAKPTNLLKIRNELYSIFTSCVDPIIIFKGIFKNLQFNGFIKNTKLIELALKYEERLLIGLKPIIHIESFIANVMVLYSKK